MREEEEGENLAKHRIGMKFVSERKKLFCIAFILPPMVIHTFGTA